MNTNSSPMQDDLSDIVPGQKPPSWLVMHAQQEASAGSPKPGGPVDQLGRWVQANQPKTTPAPSMRAAPFGPATDPTKNVVPAPQGTGPTQADVGGMAGGVQSGLLTKDQVSGIAPGSKASETTTDTDNAKRAVSLRTGYSPEQRELQEAITEGYHPKVSGYEPLKDANGTPIMDPKTGKTVDDRSQPIYDLTDLGDPNKNSLFQLGKAGSEKIKALADEQSNRAKSPAARPADLSGLMMAADFLNKTNTFGSDYARQQQNAESARTDQNKNEQQAFQDQIGAQKGQNDLYKDALSATNAGLNGGTILQQLANTNALQQMAGYGGAGMNRLTGEQQANAKIAQAYTRDPAVVKSDMALSQAAQVQNLLSQNTSPAVLMAKIATLRSSGLQRITNFEVSEFGGDQRATEQANNALQKLAFGNLDKMSVDEIRQSAAVLQASAQQVADQKREFYRKLGPTMGATNTDVLFGPSASPNTPAPPGYSHATHIKAPPAAAAPQGAVGMGGAAASVAQTWAKAHLNDKTLASDGQPNAVHAAAILQGK